MSGIAGIVNLDGQPVDRSLLEAMSAAMAHRGPDGAGIWLESGAMVGLAYRALQSTPESVHETQPLRDETGELTLVLDGRLDNREELKAAIENAGSRLRDDTDAELVLKAYQCWAEDCPQHLLGDFAFALWDGRRRRLFCARDHVGKKTFFYRFDGTTLAFASEMQPLFADSRFQSRVNVNLLARFLSLDYGDFTETLYQDVLRLPAGHSLVLEGGTLRRVRYWDIDPSRSIQYATDQQYTEHFLHLFRDSVRGNLRVRGDIAACLSGGMDSSSIVCTAASLARNGGSPAGRVVTFSQVYPGLPCDESEYISEVNRQWGLEGVSVVHGADPSTADFERVREYPDVLYSLTRHPFIPAMQEVQRRGIRGVLEGIGGDELLFSGFNHLALLARRGKFFTLLHQLRLDAANYSLTPSWLLFHRVISPMVPMPVKRALRPFLRRLGPRSEPLRLVRADFARTHGIYEHAVSLPQFPTRVQQNLYDATLRGWSTVACEMNQLFASRFQTECRWPFLSRPLIEFLLAVPQEQRWHRHESKFLLRRAMRGILPEKVRRRTDKASFNVVADLELKQRQAAKVDALFRNSLLVAAGVGDRSALNQLFARYRAGAPRLAATVELVIGLELFCRATHDRMWRA